ncbi:PAS domain-containing protein [candidate division KSB3 bacterium]|uniref:histidine kinase n=1 Tax=candidate division KSB3 bacterium TaxID=2044937 RepID=A0A9D5JZD2_9BACT|nr:PAS domain-containing protein [candidate division KSB3 bacterium]MBD3326766.1 PAS domain-containing protein [candidate division KSB3 bacterium]
MSMELFRFPPLRDQRRRYMPIVAILAAIATLVLLLVVHTSRNLTLARHRLEDSLLQEGLAFIRAIEAGNRTGMRMHWSLTQLQALVEEMGSAPKVEYLRVIGTDGTIMAQSAPKSENDSAAVDLDALKAASEQIVTRTVLAEQGPDIFEIVARVALGTGAESDQPASRMRSMGMGMMRSGMMGGPPWMSEVAMIQVGMSMAELEQIQARDLKNALLMLGLLSVVGSAALYFIVFMQNYYAVNQALQTMKGYTQHVVDSMANGLISVDTQGRVVTMNRQAHQILDIPGEQAVQGRLLQTMITFHGVDLLEILERGEPVIERELTCTTASQHVLPLSLSASILTDDQGTQLGVVVLFRDLSDVKALQEQVKRTERLASVGQLAAGVAHEIRNPLGALKGFLQYFQRKLSLPEQDRTYLSVMVNEVDRLNTVISNLLDFARPRQPVLEPCDLAAHLQHVLKLVESDRQAKGIAIRLDLEDPLPQILLDCDQITQVLLNILLNGIQATEPGGEMQIRAAVQPEDQQVELTITDSGQGIAVEDLPKIFDPFFSTKKRGSGLGLAIAHTIIEHHQGHIRVESAQGAGTTFRIYLPLNATREYAPTPPA